LTHDPYEVEPRKPLTPKQKIEMFVRHGGICCICGTKIDSVKDAWDEHQNPLWLNGDNNAENRAPAHAKCARVKTSGEAKERAKVRRIAERHFGARKTKKPKSKWKRMPDGRVVLRED
jgi:hypothetical protein